jgi:hypothetical protein
LSTEASEYRPLGVNLEATGVVVVAAVISGLLVAAVALRPRRGVLLVVGLVGTAFTVLEIAEVAHQITRRRPGLVALAALAGMLHAAVALLCTDQIAARRRVVAV